LHAELKKNITMRKITALLCVLFASVTLMAQADVKGIHPYKVEEPSKVAQDHAHWSLIPYVGVNMFFGDFNAGEAQSILSYPSLGLGAEFAFNPAWSIGLEYGFNRWKLNGNPNETNTAGERLHADTLLLGNAHMVDLYLAADLIDLILPFAKKKPVALMLSIGAGGAMHKNSVYYDMSEKNTEGRSARGNTALHPTLRSAMNKYDFNPFLKFGANLEFNINRTLALGVRAAYNMFLSDMIDGRQFNPNNDGLLDLTLNMRIKFNAVKKTHARNVPGRDFPDVRAITVAEAKDYIKDDVAEHVETAYAKGVEAAKVHDTLIIYHDTIIVEHDNISPETLAALKTVRAANAETAAESQASTRVYPRAAQNFYIYFDSFKADLNEAGLITIQQVADLMAEDESLCALIVAYCDNTGSEEINRKMGDKRAENVAAELRAEYGIDAARLFTHNHGVVVGGRSKAAYGPNRRVAITLMNKDSFNKSKAELEEQKKNKAGEEIVAMTTVVVNEATTLAKLARKYYGNTHCWVYIFAANRDHLSNPNKVPVGVELIIPEVSEEDRKINKAQSREMYENLK